MTNCPGVNLTEPRHHVSSAIGWKVASAYTSPRTDRPAPSGRSRFALGQPGPTAPTQGGDPSGHPLSPDHRETEIPPRTTAIREPHPMKGR